MTPMAESKIQFDPEPHIYTVDGRVIPSVTQILEDTGLVDYSALPPSIRDAALERGEQVHRAIALYFQGDLDESSVPANYQGYFQAALTFCMDVDMKTEPDGLEMRGYVERPEYCGTLDLVGNLLVPRIGRRNCLVDWKTGAAEPWVRLQTAAYAKFFEHPATRYRVCVELHQNGAYKSHWMPPTTFPADWQQWESVAVTYHMKRSLKW